MNFQELMRKMVEFEKPVSESDSSSNDELNAVMAKNHAARKKLLAPYGSIDDLDTFSKFSKNASDEDKAEYSKLYSEYQSTRKKLFPKSNPSASKELPGDKAELDKLRSQHDSNYQYSDDYSTYKKHSDIASKISDLEKRVKESDDNPTDSLDECGMMGGLPAPMSTSKQADSVTMNVSMNGSGAGGIRDLLNVLKDMQSTSVDSKVDTDPDGTDLLKSPITSMPSVIDDDFSNSAAGDDGPKFGGIDMMTSSGDDLHKEKGAYPKANGGDNAMKLKDGATYRLPAGNIQVKLEHLYQEIKNRDQLSEVSGELANKVSTARRKQADAAKDKDPKSAETKATKRKADDAHWNWIKRMGRDASRGKSQSEINKGYADDADKNTKRGWSND